MFKKEFSNDISINEISIKSNTDLTDLLKLRNEPESISLSLSQKKVTPKEHINWIKEKFKDEYFQVFLLKIFNKPIGFARLEKLDHTEPIKQLISIYINKDYQKIGLGTFTLETVLEQAKSNIILALIRVDNFKSKVFFQKFNFKKVESGDEDFDLYELCK
ncbi:MAG: GNAT family N-acetyltransferase [Candidatus Caenarcaniphilales bacterium]|nr:GNAT family N-acetyltransferase [Candidatus Caenarcaniphilales bacterium]